MKARSRAQGSVDGWRPELRREEVVGALTQDVEDRAHRGFEIRVDQLPDLAVGEQRGIPALRREALGEGAQGRRLAYLPGGMDDEVELLVDQPAQPGDAGLGGEHVVVVGTADARCVEEARHTEILLQPRARTP